MQTRSSIRRHAITGKSRLRQSSVMMHGNKVGTETAKPAFPLSAARPFSCASAIIAIIPSWRTCGSRTRSGDRSARRGSCWQSSLVALSGLLAHGPLSKSTVTDGGLSLTYERFQRVTALARFNARILVSYGDEASLRRARISEEDVLEAARRAHGLERMDEMKFAIFEASGRISIIPKRNVVPGEDGS